MTGLNLLYGLNMSKNKKRRDERKSSIKGKEEIKRELKVPSYFTYIFGILLLAVFVLSLYLRTVMPYDSVFRDGVVAFASDDSVFHMRLVENTLYNFPHQIFYDAFTVYPYGAPVHWGPLFTQIIATLSLIAGMGSYNMQMVNIIGAFFPSVLGALVVFPVYYIGKHLGSRNTGLLAAFMIAVLPGQFFSRSTLGFTDNHVAEVLFSSATIAFFILAIKSGRERNIKFSEVHLKDKPVLYSIFAGVMLASYQLSWPGAPFFAMIISIFILIQYIIDDMGDRSTDYLAIAAVPLFLVELISVLPYVHSEYGFGPYFYSWFHVAVPIVGMGLPIALSFISREIKKRGYASYYYPISLGGFFVLGMLAMKAILPQLYAAIIGAPSVIFAFPTGGSSTVAEALSILEKPGMIAGEFPVTGMFQTFQTDNFVLLFIIIVMLAVGYRVVRKQRPEDMLFLVWSLVMLLAMFGQNRWSYYFAVNIAIMVGYAGAALSERILKFGGWELPLNKENIGFSRVLSPILVVMLLLFFAYPAFSETYTTYSRYGGGDPSGGGFAEWLDALNWMRYNTPDPGLDYLAIYEKPKNGTYPYPKTAYGVMSWWDYGHIITYWAHRIPNANPFQAGIGGGSAHVPGASSFLTAKSEEEANSVLNALGINGKPGARYIMSNAYMAYGIMDVFGIWNEDYGYRIQIQTNQGPQVVPSSKYYDTMEAKLHIFDGNGLKNYRFVHESPINPYTQGGNEEQWYKYVYNTLLYGGKIPVENSGLVKVFEYVKGAKITGNAPPNTTVTLTNTIKTNIGRTINYSQTTTSNGTYEFTVPYSTLGPIPGETQFDTKPAGPYTVTVGNVSKQIEVSEKDVLEGNTVTLNLI
ncbi:MAG: oligosaccharyl transferase, archaeosortase A system-associated [Candidatus Methanoperedens sp.]|nr:oligosaccharyl transferase, archaeosortase A system-associated [Candidatus Methanoperedens sp.]